MADIEHPGITVDPEIMMGKPTISGTRLTVELILEELASGTTIEELLTDYPRLTREGIQAALAYAAARLHRDAEQQWGQAAS